MAQKEQYNFIKFKYEEDLSKPIGNFNTFYKTTGILDLLLGEIDKLGYYSVQDYFLKNHNDSDADVSYHVPVLPQHVFVNSHTDEEIRSAIKDAWMYYAIDRRTGNFKTDRVHKRHVKPTPLQKSDENCLSMEFLCWAPSIDENVPDDEIWVDTDFSDIRKVEEISSKEDN